MGDTGAQGYLDRQITLGTGENRARGFEDSAAVERANAKNARTAGMLGAASTMLSAPSAAFKAYGSGLRSTDPETLPRKPSPGRKIDDPLRRRTYWDDWMD
jgi:hypothetical protein